MKSLPSLLPLGLIPQSDPSSEACTPSSHPHNSPLWVHVNEKHHFEGAGTGRNSTFSCFLQECSLVSAAWRRPERASPIPPFIWRTKAISQEDQLSLCHSSSLLLVLSPSFLSFSHAHSHTRSQAVISILMEVQENVNVKEWETPEKSWERRRGALSAFCRLTLSEELAHLSGPRPARKHCSTRRHRPVRLMNTREVRGERGADAASLLRSEKSFQSWIHDVGLIRI